MATWIPQFWGAVILLGLTAALTRSTREVGIDILIAGVVGLLAIPFSVVIGIAVLGVFGFAGPAHWLTRIALAFTEGYFTFFAATATPIIRHWRTRRKHQVAA